ncbi:MAG: putative haloacid dehalogenase-like hydrolase family protein, partial [Thermoleophilia bacterium]|nr:putative haloacid dehalogenase-like hydrolase family protein [Thermoleophilia bacterium]
MVRVHRPSATSTGALAFARAHVRALVRTGHAGSVLLLVTLAALLGAAPASATNGVSGNAALELGQPANAGAEWTDMNRGSRSDRGFDTPLGVTQDSSGHVLVVDQMASRVQGWTTMPATDGAPMDHVLGQPTPTAYGTGCTASTMRAPSRASITTGSGKVRAAVADTANHRVLLWSTTTAAWPPANGTAAPIVIGQPNATTCSAGNSQTKLDSPAGVWTDGTRVIVSDTQNNRIMGWNSWPVTGAPADWVIGQTTWSGATLGTSATKLNEPTGVWSDGTDRILVADSVNNRVLFYDLPGAGTWIASGTVGGISATWAVGQSSLTGNGTGCSGTTMDLPQGVSSDGTKFAVADTNGDRVLVWNAMPTANGQGAAFALGQTALNQCNRNQGNPTTLSAAAMDGPADVWTDGATVLAVDSLNHRVLRWAWPAANGTSATRVLGHPNFANAAPFDAVKDAIFRFRSGTSLPHLEQVVPFIIAGTNRLLVANAGYNWVHYYAAQPSTNGQAPTWRFGQVDDAHQYYGGMAATNATSLGAPDGVWSDGTRLLMTDAAGDRIKVWDTFPTSENQAPDRLLGQPTFVANGSGASSSSIDNPNGVVSDGTRIAVSDETNNRILLWDSWPTTMDQPADHVIGQPTFSATTANNGGRSAHSLDTPRGLTWANGKLAVADYGNDRILVWNSWPTVDNQDADVVVGQTNFTTAGVAAFDHVHAVSVADNTLVWAADCGAAYLDPIPTANTTSTGTPLGAAACGSVAPARDQVREVGGVAIRAGKVWVADLGHARMLRFDDTTNPTITAAATRSTNCTGTTFSWSTDESGTSEVWYDTVSRGAGLPATYASNVVDPTITGLSHSVVATGLVPGTTYYYKVQTKDGAGNAVYSAEASFVAGLAAPGPSWTADADAQVGALQAPDISASSPHFSFVNNAGCSVDRQRVKVVSDPMDTNVTGLWHLDGTGADASPTGAPIVLGGGSTAPTFGASFNTPMGQEMSVDGVDDTASVAANPVYDRGNSFTLEMWTKSTATSVAGLPNAFPTLAHKGSSCASGAPSCNFELYVDRASGCLCVGVSRGGSMFFASGSATPLVDGHWHHIAITVDASNLLSLYLDGTLRATQALAGPTDAPNQPMVIGSGNGGNRWRGQIDDVRYSSVARTAAEVRGTFEARQPHGRTLWDSDPTDAGVPLAACGAARCADVTYGSSGSAAAALTGGRSTVQSKVRAGAGAWSLTGSDWFEMDTGRPVNQYADTTDASTGFANRTGVTAVAPHLSWINTAGTSVDHDHTQVVTTPPDDVQLLLHLDGSAADSSGNGFAGTLTGAPAPTWGQAQPNFGGASGALRVTNGNDVVTVPSDPKLERGNDFTVETWFRTSSIANA